jgi:acetyl-CoA C-acetyltransferase
LKRAECFFFRATGTVSLLICLVDQHCHRGSLTHERLRSAENTAKKLNISRAEQDDFAIESYRRAQDAIASGAFADEIVPVKLKKGNPVTEDEEPKRIKLDKVRSLRTAFQKENGTITAANASSLNDGASAVVLASKAKVDEHGLKPLAKIIGTPRHPLLVCYVLAETNRPSPLLAFADAACDPIDFPLAPTLAVPLALKRAGLTLADVRSSVLSPPRGVIKRARVF